MANVEVAGGVPGAEPPQSGVVGNVGVDGECNIGVVGDGVGVGIDVGEEVGNGCCIAAAAAIDAASSLARFSS